MVCPSIQGCLAPSPAVSRLAVDGKLGCSRSSPKCLLPLAWFNAMIGDNQKNGVPVVDAMKQLEKGIITM